MPRILIADDDVTIQLELEESLRQMHYDVVGIADDGISAIDMACELKPDLILMDVVMSGPVDGISAAERIKLEVDAGVIFISGFDDPDYIERAKQVEPFGYVMKPFDEREIRGVIEIVLQKRDLELQLKSAHKHLEKVNRKLRSEIEERKKIERTLSERERYFKAIYEQSPIGIEIYNGEGELERLNEACLEIFGVTDSSDVIGFKLFEDPNLSEESKNRLRQGEKIRYQMAFDFEKVKKWRLYHTRKSGVVHLDVQIVPLNFPPEESVSGYLVQIIDMTKMA